VLALGTMALMAVLMARGVKGAMLVGMLASTAIGLSVGLVKFQGLIARPPSLAPTFMKLDVLGAFRPGLVDVVIVFFFLALFDSIGTLIGVAERAGLTKDGRLPRARQALLADAIGTVVGAGLGTSTVTAYVESATGVAAGGRTGLTSVVTSALFLLALFMFPLVKTIGGGYPAGNHVVLYPVVAPALVLVGVVMMEGVRHIPWDDLTEAIPAFLTLITMPLAVSVTDGVAFGFIAFALLKLATGRHRELDGLGYVFALLFLLRYAMAR
jgi:AGZA family xanthine/uracil permease-like MFS transporter